LKRDIPEVSTLSVANLTDAKSLTSNQSASSVENRTKSKSMTDNKDIGFKKKSTFSFIKGSNKNKSTKENKTFDFVNTLSKIMQALDPERFETVLEKIQGALPGPAQPVAEPVFECLYDMLDAAAEAKNAVQGTVDHAVSEGKRANQESTTTAKGGNPESPTKSGQVSVSAPIEHAKTRDGVQGNENVPGYKSMNQMQEQNDVELGSTGTTEFNLVEGKKLSLVWRLRKEPEWLILIAIALLGLMTISLLTAISVSPDCGCSNLHT
jgi:hypothetical protein